MIHLERVCKRFRLYPRPADRLWEAITGRCRHQWHTAVDRISLEVKPGETVALLGRNGAGKSTLLKLVTGVLLPDSGHVKVDGRVTGLLELGTGFDPRLSGRQNIHVNGLMLGMTTEELAAREEAIIDFAELGRYIDEPLRTYSSGMAMRLGFSVAIHAQPQCFVVDEALAVGDARFQQKCVARIREFKEQGGSILFVSHDMNAIKMLADRAMVVEEGRAIFTGSPEECVAAYLRSLAGVDNNIEPEEQRGYGSGEVVIEAVRLAGSASGQNILGCGESARIEARVFARETVADVVLGFMLRDRFGQDLFGTNSWLHGTTFSLEAGNRYRITAELKMLLHPGRYTITAALHRGQYHSGSCFHWWDNAAEFEVAGVDGPCFAGVCRLPLDRFQCQPFREKSADD